ncbi:hypothetical protein AX15_006813 [Amanita polypyramis BW_CC]|nr:hypothetical protein AX15_006813 [Amanita polypyramis BW_CC]
MSSSSNLIEQVNREQDAKGPLDSVLKAHLGLKEACEQLSLQTDPLTKAQVDKNGPLSEIKGLNERLTQHAEKQNGEVELVKKKMYELWGKLLGERDEYVKSQVKDEIARQAEEETRRQIGQFLPVSLERQAVEGRGRLEKLETALHNSDARLENGRIKVSYWLEPLKTVLKEDGKKSDFYPVDLSTLYSYDGDTMKALLTSYDMQVDETDDWHRVNFNRFVRFIGVRGQLDEEVE